MQKNQENLEPENAALPQEVRGSTLSQSPYSQVYFGVQERTEARHGE